ncbi:MAG: prolyl oligopeptidase family serine peptidase [Colwellia polaris]|jgi:dipeptidyl aminopeptidase/acylaminoacyl peptidase|uniref:S9 family peptidase n=1 Tax=Colwellia polaris TaxID=326537 RepID=UPI000A1751E0|nr:prolyl oligopeptidase family serine peptidase [Colwellia polaris]|tara:strand:- start:7706 stop:10186 length:2481 start_codon:yes stop_codon:yes gene_type:complete
MKIQLIAAAISFSLAACASTAQKKVTLDNNSTTTNDSVASEVQSTPAAGEASATIITLEKIMSDPDWFGRSPESWYWGDDSETVFYQQKRVGNPLRDLIQKNITTQGNGDLVKLAQMHVVADSDAVLNSEGTQEVYTFEGNVFVKTLATQSVQQLTYTSAVEHSAMFLTNGNVAYRVGNVFYAHDMNSQKIIELANLKMSDGETPAKGTPSYIANEQQELIEYVALQQRNKKLFAEQNRQLRVKNSTVTQTNFYFGKDNQIVHASLSPAGDKLIVSIASDKSTRKDSDIMPNYISDDGNIKAQSARHRVADNRQYAEQLYILDLNQGTKALLSYENLPGFDEDVLASVRKENYAREGKKYSAEKSPRNIHVMQAWDPIQWQDNGKQVAVMLEAWDNKDRWIATVNFNDKTLVSQHRLHDDAWVNYAFNEMGWLSNADAIYYLSEESGYAHLYVKPLNGKAKALTSGNFEVDDLTVSADETKIYFKANKKHPGIYEIYNVDLASGKVNALTDLGGMNDYALSPDESKLLVQHSEITMPPELYVKELTNNVEAIRLTHTVTEAFRAMPWSAPNVVAIESSHQEEPIYSKVYLPKGYDQTTTKNKAVMFSHGAGYLQNSHLGWSGYFREYMFHSMLVQQGYVVIDMDYRASKGYGRDWRTAIYRHMGKPEVQDMRDGVNWLIENAHVDAERVGTYGGSYGGFLTLMSMFTDPDLFQSGSALRLVSDWAYYNHGYTANILNTPADDAIAYERSSPIYFAEGLEKPLLINAPMVDDNVFFQDTVRLVQRLIELEKQDFETAIYPVEPHGFVQPSSWLNEYRRIYKLFENTL